MGCLAKVANGTQLEEVADENDANSPKRTRAGSNLLHIIQEVPEELKCVRMNGEGIVRE